MAQITAAPHARQRLSRTEIPLPPNRLREDGFHPMRAWELDLIVASYNNHTEEWNAYECSGGSKLHCPRWTFVESKSWSFNSPNVLWFTLRSGRRGVISIVCDWDRYHDGLSCRLNPIPAEHVRWAGWEVPAPPEIVDKEEAEFAHLLHESALNWKIRHIANVARKRPRRVMMLPVWAETCR